MAQVLDSRVDKADTDSKRQEERSCCRNCRGLGWGEERTLSLRLWPGGEETWMIGKREAVESGRAVRGNFGLCEPQESLLLVGMPHPLRTLSQTFSNTLSGLADAQQGREGT